MTRVRKHWTLEEDETLRRLFDTGATFARIGEQMGRNATSCFARSVALGLDRYGRADSAVISFERPLPTLAFVPHIEIGGRYTMRAV